MQPALAPALHNMRTGQTEADQNMQQALMMHAHSMGDAQQGMMAMDQQDSLSAGESKRGGKRELSTSKRAAQNRAAQRAFRQRKEGHIKKLEEQVRDYQTLADSYKAVQAENYQLRDYIINLQSRLIESQGDFPPAPGNIDLRQPLGGPPTGELPTASSDTADTNDSAAPTAGAALDLVSNGNKGGKGEIVDPSLGGA